MIMFIKNHVNSELRIWLIRKAVRYRLYPPRRRRDLMATRKLRPGAGLAKGAAGRRGFFQDPAMLIFLAILAGLAVIAGAASGEGGQAFFQKGKNTMQQEAAAPRAESGNLPSLDALGPVRVETFTFGLG
jgi:hypothetical protein